MVPATSTRVRQTAKPAGLAMPRRGALAARGLPNQAQIDFPGAPAVISAEADGPSTTLVATTPPAKAATPIASAMAAGSGAAARRLSRSRQDDADPSGSDPPPSDM